MIARETREKRKRKKVKIPEEKKRETIGKKENEAERGPTVLMLNHGVSIFGPSERRPAAFPFSPLPTYIPVGGNVLGEEEKRAFS